MREMLNTLSSINNIWGAVVIIVILALGWNSLTDNVATNGKRTDAVLEILKNQTVIMSSLAQSFKDVKRDHILMQSTQDKTNTRNEEMLRLMDRISATMDRLDQSPNKRQQPY